MTTTGAERGQRAPLWAALAATFVGSLGTGAVSNGIYFIATSRHDFGHVSNFGLGLVLGVVYVPSALLIGPVIRRFIRWSPRVTTRRVLGAQTLLMALLCFGLGPVSQYQSALWVFAGVYGVLTGAHWPLMESFLSGGRKDHDLRVATGRFNITWTFAVAFSIVAMSPLIKDHPILVVQALGLAHLGGLVILRWLPPEPAAHVDDAPHVVPESYHRLLKMNRVLLPVSYVLLSALNPYWPNAFATLGVLGGAQTLLASVWMFARVGTVIVLERWHGWHGTRSTPTIGTVLLGVGFGSGVAVPVVGEAFGTTIGVIVALGALSSFGVGMAVVYTGALYYAMEVGTGGVDDGGKHEGLIGIGYTVGPLFGLAGLGVEGANLVSEGYFRWVMLGLAACVFAGAAVSAARIASRPARKSNHI